MKRKIVNPHWINNARTIISADFVYDDGRVLTATISESETTNPDLIEIKQNFSNDQLEENTRQKIRTISDQRQKDQEQKDAQALRKQQEELFAAKLKIFEIDSIKNSTNREMKSRIRKSKSDMEAIAWAAVLMLEEVKKEVEVVETPVEG
jgi:transcriptional regulator of heat shock response